MVTGLLADPTINGSGMGLYPGTPGSIDHEFEGASGALPTVTIDVSFMDFMICSDGNCRSSFHTALAFASGNQAASVFRTTVHIASSEPNFPASSLRYFAASWNATVVPEPSSAALMLAGAAVFAWLRRRASSKRSQAKGRKRGPARIRKGGEIHSCRL